MKLRVGIICAFLNVALQTEAAFDIFLKLDNVKGESQNARHAGEMDILAWSWGMSNTGGLASGSGAATGKVLFEQLNLTKYADTASPVLMLSTANGKQYQQAILTLRRASESSSLFYRITLDDVIVTSVSTGGSSSDARIIESITLSFAKVKVEYYPQKADGSQGEPTTFTWNIAANSP